MDFHHFFYKFNSDGNIKKNRNFVRNLPNISDILLMQNMEYSISQIIRDRILNIKVGELFTINDFEDVNNDNLVTRTLSRLQNEGAIVRVATGIYMNPKHTQFGILYPTLDQIAHKIAERDKAQIMPTGDTALNILGFSTQVPMNAVYITNGAKRKVKVGERTIIFKNAVQKNFQFKGKLLPLIIIALKELGESRVTNEIRNKIISLISESKTDERTTMMNDLYLSPVWIKELLLPIIKKITE
ncbi:MAG: hypothetical protein JXR34_05090 [Bacteroidales bacterium]|nr:hypothetical protein [Bacteroidales bacterium]